MNCKPGDLAIVVSPRAGEFEGRIVTCIARTHDKNTGAPGWIVEPRLGNWRGVYDGALRPIRDPGDDARDETLNWLPVPHKETV